MEHADEGALSVEEVAVRLGRIQHARQVAQAVRLVAEADMSSLTGVDVANAGEEVDAAHLGEWATAEFGDDADAILIAFIEDLNYFLWDPLREDDSFYDDCVLALKLLGHIATTTAVDFLERIGGYAFKPGADPESAYWKCVSSAIGALALVDSDRARAVLMAWFEAVDERWELDEDIMCELLAAITPNLNASYVSKVLWLGSLWTQDLLKWVHRAISAHPELFRPSVIDGLQRRDPAVAGVLYPLFRQTSEAEEVLLLQEVRDDPAADSRLRERAGSVLDAAKRPPPQPQRISTEQIFKWRSLAADAHRAS